MGKARRPFGTARDLRPKDIEEWIRTHTPKPSDPTDSSFTVLIDQRQRSMMADLLAQRGILDMEALTRRVDAMNKHVVKGYTLPYAGILNEPKADYIEVDGKIWLSLINWIGQRKPNDDISDLRYVYSPAHNTRNEMPTCVKEVLDLLYTGKLSKPDRNPS